MPKSMTNSEYRHRGIQQRASAWPAALRAKPSMASQRPPAESGTAEPRALRKKETAPAVVMTTPAMVREFGLYPQPCQQPDQWSEQRHEPRESSRGSTCGRSWSSIHPTPISGRPANAKFHSRGLALRCARRQRPPSRRKAKSENIYPSLTLLSTICTSPDSRTVAMRAGPGMRQEVSTAACSAESNAACRLAAATACRCRNLAAV